MTKLAIIKAIQSRLGARLLIFVLGFAALIELFFFLPGLGNYRLSFLFEQINTAQTIALALEETPGQEITAELEQEIIISSNLSAIIVLRSDSRQMILRRNMPDQLTDRFELEEVGLFQSIIDSLATLKRQGNGFIMVGGPSTSGRYTGVQVVLSERPLYLAMLEYIKDSLFVTAGISLFAAIVLYLAIIFMFVAPLNRMKENIIQFRQKPEDPGRIIKPRKRPDELGIVQEELSRLQDELQRSLKRKTHLANLGTSLSKINHDLRNILTSAQLSSDRLQEIEDPVVRRLVPRLVRSLDRAISLCEETLKYGKAEECKPQKKAFKLAMLVDEVALDLGLEDQKLVQFENKTDPNLTISADPEHLYRILFNLIRNALQAFEEEGSVTINAFSKNSDIHITIADTGPGIPKAVRENLFLPFTSRSKSGTGLGLAIVKELVEAHGGFISLAHTHEGTMFEIILPQPKPKKSGKKRKAKKTKSL